MSSNRVIVSGSFDDIRSREIRLLEEASKLGDVRVLLWSDEAIESLEGKSPKFPFPERQYLLRALRYVSHCEAWSPDDADTLPDSVASATTVWVDFVGTANERRSSYSDAHHMRYSAISEDVLKTFPKPASVPSDPARRKVVVTGCYDWFHSGHVRFFEEVSAHGDLYVVVGHDANIRLLKGAGHPLIPQDERRYVAAAVRYVKEALISSGEGWLDADPEIRKIKPDIYAVNEDGDKGGKREYCERMGMEYLVLKRSPAPGLPVRTSTSLRGF